MGLDITAYKSVEHVRDIDPNNDDWEDCDFKIRADDDFRERAADLTPGIYQGSRDTLRFRAGSYSGYNRWREELAELVGVTAKEIWAAAPDDEAARATPFYEMINFTDCDGVLGPAVCTKLAKDFDTWAEKAGDVGYFAEIYVHFRAAFRLAASGGGVVQFH